MAGPHGAARAPVTAPTDKIDGGERFTLFAALRWIEATHPDRPRLGRSQRAAEDPVRLTQVPTLRFAPGEVNRIETKNKLRLHNEGFGLLGPNGPLPIHLTEYADERIRQAQDPSFADFLNIFHHRMASLFYRAWADAEPTVEADRADDRFRLYLGALIGLGTPALRDRHDSDDRAKLHRAGRFAGKRSREDLEDIIEDYFGLRVRILPFQAAWLEIPPRARLRLTQGTNARRLGHDANLGQRSWQCQFGFRVVLLDLDRAAFLQLLPGTSRLAQLGELVRFFIGDEMRWDLELRLAPGAAPPLRLARGARLGWSTWLGRRHRGPTRSHIRDIHTSPRPAPHPPTSPPRKTQHG